MISLDISILYQVILFLVLWVILNKVLFQPYLRVLQEREVKTTGAQHDSSALEHEGAALKRQYEEKIAQSQAAGYAVKDAIVQEGRQQRERILSQAREEAAASLDNVRREIAAAMQHEKQTAAAEVSAVASDIASKIIGRTVA